MPFISPTEELAMERGEQKGIQQGIQQGIQREQQLITALPAVMRYTRLKYKCF
ncbi:hypothetical protein WJM97_22955 (plasmid) [Okeanomitos corallinicola TIOX110]|uniref:Transposase n=1 Tax=Okeanomitos corallinicola TIOX110 TaxID=3133117 RepID=A0ABZ2UZC1_9CYAN